MPPSPMWAFDHCKIHHSSKHTVRTMYCIRIRHSQIRSYHTDWALWDSNHPTHLFNILWTELNANLSCINVYVIKLMWDAMITWYVIHVACLEYGLQYLVQYFPMNTRRCKMHQVDFKTCNVSCELGGVTQIIFWWGVQPEVWNTYPFVRIFLPQKMGDLMVLFCCFKIFASRDPFLRVFLPQKRLISYFGEMGPSSKDFLD